MITKDLLRLVPTIQAIGLVGANLKVINKKKVNTKDVVKLGMTNIIGVSLIKAESDWISEM